MTEQQATEIILLLRQIASALADLKSLAERASRADAPVRVTAPE